MYLFVIGDRPFLLFLFSFLIFWVFFLHMLKEAMLR